MKKIAALLLVLIMCISTLPAVDAARDTAQIEVLAQTLKSLGIFRGVSDTEFDLGRAPTRVEALVMLIRLLGKETTALEGSFEHPFSDVPQWADGYVGYAYENGLTQGISDTEFGTGTANIQMYLTFVLRAIDYKDGGVDFSYSEPYSTAYHAGVLPASVDRENFLRADCVIISYAALSSYIKNTTKTLATKLIDEGVFTEADFLRYYDKTLVNYDYVQKDELSAEEIYKLCSPGVFYIEVYDKNGQVRGSGSGFFIDSDGTAVTNYHVIEDMYSAKVSLSDSDGFYEVEGVYDYGIQNDWAIIKIKGTGFHPLAIGDRTTVVGGGTVYAIGSPMGLQNTISQGLISNTNRVLDGVTYIQTSAPISQGSSGGAFINKYGEVIGITSAGFTDGENLGLAIPISVIEGYKKETITPLHQITAQGSAPNGENGENYSAERLLAAFVTMYANEDINGSKAFTKRESTYYGYYDLSVVLEPDGALKVLLWEMYGGDTYYCSVYLTGREKGQLYYSYRSLGGLSEFIGIKTFSPTEITRGVQVRFDNANGNTRKEDEEDIATEYVEDGFDFINEVFGYMSDIESYSVADLGFVNYR